MSHRTIVRQLHVQPDQLDIILEEGLLSDSIQFEHAFYRYFMENCDEFKHMETSFLKKIVVITSIRQYSNNDNIQLCKLCLATNVCLTIHGKSYIFTFDTDVLLRLYSHYKDAIPKITGMYDTYDSIIAKLDQLFYSNKKTIVQKHTSLEIINNIFDTLL